MKSRTLATAFRALARLSLVASVVVPATVGAADDVRVNEPWARATVPGQKVAGAYMEIVSAADARLTGVSSPLAGAAEVHSMTMQDGTMRMRKVDVLELPAGRPVKLEPGGYHIMLFDLKQPLAVGQQVPLTLSIEQAGKRARKISVTAVVRGRDDARKP